MTWFRLDDGWLTHPKMQAIGPKGRELWLAGGLHCAQHLTDGRIEKRAVKVLAAQAEVPHTAARKIVEVGLWLDAGDHYVMRDYLDYQPSREQVERERARWRRYKASGRATPEMSTAEPRAEATVDRDAESTENPPRTPRSPVPLVVTNGCTEASAVQPVAAAAAEGSPVVIDEAVAIVAERRRIAAQAPYKRFPEGWQASAMSGIRREVTAAGHRAPPDATAEMLADLVEPLRPPRPTPPDPLEATQRAAAAIASRDRSCARCSGSGVWLDDDGDAHECDHARTTA